MMIRKIIKLNRSEKGASSVLIKFLRCSELPQMVLVDPSRFGSESAYNRFRTILRSLHPSPDALWNCSNAFRLHNSYSDTNQCFNVYMYLLGSSGDETDIYVCVMGHCAGIQKWEAPYYACY